MSLPKSLALCALLLSPALPWAHADDKTVEKSTIRLTVTQDKSELIALESQNAPLSEVLDSIAAKTGVQVHYSALPIDRVTATCAGESLKQVMACLLGPSANLIFRYPRGQTQNIPHGQPEEFWVLGSSLAPGKATQCASASPAQKSSPKKQKKSAGSAAEIAGLIEMTGAEDPGQRATALSQLAADGHLTDARARQAMESGMTDADPNVRIQAINGLAQLGGAEAAHSLQQALHDSDANVRLMAVSAAGDDPASMVVLKSALVDSDETVRELANMKLQSANPPAAPPGP